MDCRSAYQQMHIILDGDMSPREKQLFLQHMEHCRQCKSHYDQLQKTEMMLRSAAQNYGLTASPGFTEKVIRQLPHEGFVNKWKRFMKRHPFLVAAVLFFVLMGGSLYSTWNEGTEQFQLTAAYPEKLQVDHVRMTVVVPEDTVIDGDIVVKNGTIEVNGEVKGNVVAIDGEVLLASTAHVSGQAQEINQLLEWIWYYIKKMFN